MKFTMENLEKVIEEYVKEYSKQTNEVTYEHFMNYLYNKNWDLGLEIVDNKELQELLRKSLYKL